MICSTVRRGDKKVCVREKGGEGVTVGMRHKPLPKRKPLSPSLPVSSPGFPHWQGSELSTCHFSSKFESLIYSHGGSNKEILEQREKRVDRVGDTPNSATTPSPTKDDQSLRKSHYFPLEQTFKNKLRLNTVWTKLLPCLLVRRQTMKTKTEIGKNMILI